MVIESEGGEVLVATEEVEIEAAEVDRETEEAVEEDFEEEFEEDFEAY